MEEDGTHCQKRPLPENLLREIVLVVYDFRFGTLIHLFESQSPRQKLLVLGPR